MTITAINNNMSAYKVQRNSTTNNAVAFGISLPKVPVAKVIKEGESFVQKLGRIFDCIGGKKTEFDFCDITELTTSDRKGTLRKLVQRNWDGSSHISIYDKNKKILKQIDSDKTQKGLEKTIVIFNPSKGTSTTIKKIDGKEAYRTKFYQNGQQV